MKSHPHFCIAGAQKSATTWLAQCLSEHPDIYIPRQKELHFFCPSSECRFSTARNGINWYNQIFQENATGKITGDCTTDYMYYPDCHRKLFEQNAEMKIIFLLRNPIDRAYSAYWMRKRRDPGIKSFGQLISEENGYIRRGFYADQIKPFIKCFGRKNIHILIYEEFFENVEEQLAGVFKFLGLSQQFSSSTVHQRIGATRNLKFGLNYVLYGLVARVLNAPIIHTIWKKLRTNRTLSEILERAVGLISQEASSYPTIEKTERLKLLRAFEVENKKLFRILGREIENWKN